MTSSLRFDEFINKLSPTLNISSVSNNLKSPPFLSRNEFTDEIGNTNTSVSDSPKGKRNQNSVVKNNSRINEALEDIQNIVSYSHQNINKINIKDDRHSPQVKKEIKKVDLNDIFNKTVNIQDLDRKSKTAKIATDIIRNSSKISFEKSLDSDDKFLLSRNSSPSTENLFKLLAMPPESLAPNKKREKVNHSDETLLRRSKSELTVDDKVISIQSSEEDDLFSFSGILSEENMPVNKSKIKKKNSNTNQVKIINKPIPENLIAKNTFNKLDPPVPSIKVKRMEISTRSSENLTTETTTIKTIKPILRPKSPVQILENTSSPYLKDDFDLSTVSSREFVGKVVAASKNKLTGHKLSKSPYHSEVLYQYPSLTEIPSISETPIIPSYDDSLASAGEDEKDEMKPKHDENPNILIFEDDNIKSGRELENSDLISEFDMTSKNGFFSSKLPPVSPSDDQQVNYKVHKRIQGWKLTNPRRRQDLVNMLDTIHNVNPKESLSTFSKFLLDDHEQNPYKSTPKNLKISKKKGSIIEKRVMRVPPLTYLTSKIQAIDEFRVSSPPTEPIYYMQEVDPNIEEEESMAFDVGQSTDFNFRLESPSRPSYRQTRAWVKEVNRVLKVRHTYSTAVGIKILAEEKIKKKKKMEIAESNYKLKHSLFMESFDNSESNIPNELSYMRPLERNVITPTIVSSRMLKFNNDSPENSRAKTPLSNRASTPLLDQNSINDKPESRARTPNSRVPSARITSRASSPNNGRRSRSKSPNRRSDLQDMYDYPININRSLERMDIIENVNNRIELEIKDQEIQNKNKSEEII